MERYNQLIDVWVHAREKITAEMMKDARGRLALRRRGVAKPGDKEAKPTSTRST
jgi:hypothetical protein